MSAAEAVDAGVDPPAAIAAFATPTSALAEALTYLSGHTHARRHFRLLAGECLSEQRAGLHTQRAAKKRVRSSGGR
jgi:hypothetical protein